MQIRASEKYSLRVVTTVCSILAILVMATAVWAQTQNWWIPGAQAGLPERGKIDEIKTKKKVYVNVTFESTGPNQITNTTEQSDIKKNVLDAFKAHKTLTVVPNGAMADFAVIVRAAAGVGGAEAERPANFSVALDPDAEISVDVTVLAPGTKQSDGSFKSRLVWQASSPNVQTEAGAGVRFAVDGFLWELLRPVNLSQMNRTI
jgi:hypothetical protein